MDIYRKTKLCINSGWCLPTIAILPSLLIKFMNLDRASCMATVRFPLLSAAERACVSFGKWMFGAVRKKIQINIQSKTWPITVDLQKKKITKTYPNVCDRLNNTIHENRAVDRIPVALHRPSYARGPDIVWLAHNVNPLGTDHIFWRNSYWLHYKKYKSNSSENAEQTN